MRRTARGLLAAAAALTAGAAVAEAAPLSFVLTGATTSSWTIDAQPAPDESATGTAFELDGVAGDFGGGIARADLTFFDAAYGGGLQIFDPLSGLSPVVADGAQLYDGSAEMPTFRTGSFALNDSGGAATYTLTIGAPAAAVPEPATWALALVGFGAIGAATRRARSSAFAA